MQAVVSQGPKSLALEEVPEYTCAEIRAITERAKKKMR